MQVRAIKTGYYGLKRRREGELFNYDAKDVKDLPSWVEAVEEERPQRGKPTKAPPPASAGSVTDQDVL